MSNQEENTKERSRLEKKCKYCDKLFDYYRYGNNDYVCKEHLFKDR